MDFTTHQFAKGGVDEPVSGQRRLSGELRRDNEQSVVTAAAPCACMTGVLRRVVNQFHARWPESGQPVAQIRFEIGFEIAGRFLRWGLAHAGKAFLKGLTLTLA